MTSRERFEAWMKERFPHSDTSRFALTMFISWQAAERQALERAVELFEDMGDPYAAQLIRNRIEHDAQT